MIADGVAMTKGLVGRYLAGFDDVTATRQLPGLPNHAAWSLGHCALTMHRVAEKLDGQTLPTSDFGAPSRERFSPEAVAFGSTPTGDAGTYPGIERAKAIFDAACDRLATAARSATNEKLAEQVQWGNAALPLGLLCLRMAFHNGMHCGQIADLRRGLGFKSIFS